MTTPPDPDRLLRDLAQAIPYLIALAVACA
jgi:hypothetical protein